MGVSRHLISTVLVCGLLLAGLAMGWFAPLDNTLRDLRFSLAERPASGDIVFIGVDEDDVRSYHGAGGLHGLYGDLVEGLLDVGAAAISVSLRLGPNIDREADEALLDRLRYGQGRMHTVALWSDARRPGPVTLEMPLERFASIAPPVVAEGLPDADGVVRSYRPRIVNNGWVIESLATKPHPDRRSIRAPFLVDYGIDLDSVPQMAVSDVIGDEAGLDLSGKHVLVASKTVTLQDGAVVPRHGLISTARLQLLAAETVRQDRMLNPVGFLPVALVILAAGVLYLVARNRVPLGWLVLGLAGSMVLIEAIAIGLHAHAALVLDTAAIHLLQGGFLFMALWSELEARGVLLNSTSRERDSMRGILTRFVADNFDGVVVVDHQGLIRAASRLAEEMVGQDLQNRDYRMVLPPPLSGPLAAALENGSAPHDIAEVIIFDRHGADRIVEFVVTLSSVDAEKTSRHFTGRVACLTFRDITERRQAQERMTYLAQHDPMSGAASRARFLEAAGEMLKLPMDRARGASVFLVGLTRLKTVNDTLGHAFGDELLRQVVERLETTGVPCVARLEGNVFGVLRDGLLDAHEHGAFANELIALITRPYAVGGHHAIVGASVGMTDTHLSSSDPETLVSHASMALSAASADPGNTWQVFTSDMDARIKSRQDMEIALRTALENEEFSVHYQSQVDLESGAVIGVEALVRWTHPDMGNISPASFIPVAEETGLIIAIGRWVLETACREVAGWPHKLRLSVNMSPLQVEHGDIVSDVRHALEVSGLPADRLDIEITESLLVTETSHVTEALRQLRADGVRVALDDFGTGYSSLSYLGRLPVDTIKIDQSFVRGLPEDVQATAIVRAVLMLSESLGKDVIAEGIETEDQAWILRLAGCRIGQGYHFGRPQAASDLLAALGASDADTMPHMRVG